MSQILYNPDDLFDVTSILYFINEFTRCLNIHDVKIESRRLDAIVGGMKFDFPHIDGQDDASPFKKAANFLCYFVSERPILDGFPAEKVGKEIAQIHNHQNALVGFMFVCKALQKATIFRSDGVVQIENPIQLSKHSLLDIVDALAVIPPHTHFKVVSVLLEQLVYKTNPGCQYKCAEVQASYAVI